MNKKAQLIQSGLKCDNPKCDWKDWSIKAEDYELYVNSPCPKCKENILTEEDYRMSLIFHSAIDMVNSMTDEDLEAFNNLDLSYLNEMFSEEDAEKIKQNQDKTFTVEVDMHKGINFKLKE